MKFNFLRKKLFFSVALIVISAASIFFLGKPGIVWARTANVPDQNFFEANGSVYASALSPDGKILYLGGEFTMVSPRTGGGAGFNVATQDIETYHPKVAGSVKCSVSDGSGGWYIGGTFTNVGSYTRNNIAHILSDGSVDSVWDPEADGPVDALAVSGSTVYAAGEFSSIGNQGRAYIAALNNTTGDATSWDPEADSYVYALAVSGNKIYAGGDFSNIGNQDRAYIAALNNTTGDATSWDPEADSDVYALAVSGSTIYAGGDFNSIGGQDRTYIAALNNTNGNATGWDPEADSDVFALAASSSTIYVGGDFSNIGTQSRSYIAALNNTNGNATGWDPESDSDVYALAVSGSTVYAGGDFTYIGGQDRNNFVALDATSAAVDPWDPQADGGSIINSLAVSGSNIFVGGDFSSIGGESRSNIAAFDTATGNVISSWDPEADDGVFSLAVSGSIVYAGGIFANIGGQMRDSVAALDAETGDATTWNPGADGVVEALSISGSTLYVGGAFANIGGAGHSYLAAFDTGSGDIISAWDPEPDMSVEALAAGDTTVYVGGDFSTIANQTRDYAAAFAIDTGEITGWDPEADGEVYALVATSSTVYVGGDFLNIGGQPRSYLAVLDADSGIANGWDPEADSNVFALAVNGSTVYAGGSFSNIAGQPHSDIAAVDADTGVDTGWDPGIDGNANTIIAADSAVYVGGEFWNAGGQPRQSIAAFDVNPVHKIANCTDLQNIDSLIEDNPDAAYDIFEITVPTIDCGNINGTGIFLPISHPFYGTLEGNDSSITNFKISDDDDANVGLFGNLENGAVVKNLSIAGDSVSSASGGSLGVLAGLAQGNITIQNVTSTIVNLIGEGDSEVGGLIGNFEDVYAGPGLVMNNVHVSTAISAADSGAEVGGLIGDFNSNGGGDDSVTDSDFSGSISANGSDNAGGLIGHVSFMAQETILITGSFVSADISAGSDNGNSSTGGLIGEYIFTGDSKLTINDCHYSGNQITDGDSDSVIDSVGGLVGFYDNSSNDYSRANVIDHSYSTGKIVSYGDNDFVGGLIGQLDNSGACIGVCPGSIAITDSYSSGDVTGDPADADGYVGGIAGAVSGNGNNLDFSLASSSVSGSVSGDYEVGGLIGIAYGSIDIRDVTSTITSLLGGADSSEIGGLIGQYYDDDSGNGLSMDDVHVSSTISGADSGNNPNVGGMVGGFLSDGGARHSVTGSTVSGTILSNGDSTGGVIGFASINSNEVISLGNNNISSVISGSNDTGGLIGYYYFDNDPKLTITKSGYSGGQIDGGNNVGGLIGIFENGSPSYSQVNVISQSYSTGIINASGGNAGGLIGWDDNDLDCGTACTGGLLISTSYDSGAVIGQQGYAGGLVGVVSNDNFLLENSYASSTVSGDVEVGGLVGDFAGQLLGTVDRSYSSGVVTAMSNNVGGAVGDLEDPSLLTNSFSTSDVGGTTFNYGGLTGNTDNDETQISNSYWFDSLDNGVGDGDDNSIPGKFVKAGSAASFQGNSTNPPLDQWNFSGPNPIWLVNAGAYPTLNPNYDATTTAYTLQYSADSNGSIASNSLQFVLAGTDGIAVTAVPNDGYLFVNWSDGSTANPRVDTAVNADVAVTANFGAGTSHSITDCQDLQDIDSLINNNSAAAYYDYEITVPVIDCAAINGGNGFYPITNQFYGTLNGNNAKIINLDITNGHDTATGLFEDLESGATIKNLSLSGDTFSAVGSSFIGALAGFAEGNIIIQNVTSTIANLDGTGNLEVGGLIGEYDDNSAGPGLAISNTHVSSTITADSSLTPDAGGLIGNLHTFAGGTQSITDSSFSGSISAFGGLTAGGLIGFIEADGDDDISIDNSSASGDILGGSNYGTSLIGYGLSATGGLIGHFYFTDDPSLTISNSHYSNGQITDGDSGTFDDAVGGLLGIYDNESSYCSQTNTISQSYSSGDIVSRGNTNAVGGLVGQLYSSEGCAGGFSITDSYSSGDVTGDPTDSLGYVGGLVGIIGGLNRIGVNFNLATSSVSGIISGDSDVGGLAGVAVGKVTIQNFTSNFSNLNGGASAIEVGGMFGDYADDDSGPGLTMDNVHVSTTISAIASGGPFVGGLIGIFESNGGGEHSITDSDFNGSIDAADDGSTGGLIGYLQADSDENISIGSSSVSSDISSGGSVGGLIGEYFFTADPKFSITDSSFTGSQINGGTFVGGLLGVFENSSASYSQVDVISQSYSTGKINATGDFVGGLIGDLLDDEICGTSCTGGLVISASHNSGDVIASNSHYVGGLVGAMSQGNFSIANSYASSSVSGNSEVGGLAGDMLQFMPIMSIDRSYAYGTVSAVTDNASGLVGNLESGNISNSFSAGDVSGGGSNIGGLVGNAGDENSLLNDYWFDSLANGVGNGAEDISAGHFVKAGSAASFQNNSSNSPLDQWNFSGPNPIWLAAVSAFPALNPDYLANTTVYRLDYSAGINGTISENNAQFVLSGTDGSAVTAAASNGYHFVNWSDSSTDNPRTDTNVIQDISVSANFAVNPIAQYTLTYAAGANGSLTGSSTQVVNSGSSGSAVTADPAVGYHFVNWSDNSTDNPRADAGVTQDISVTANFGINTYTLAYVAGTNGSITGSSTQVVNSGSGGSAVTAVPDSGYRFVNWSDGPTANPRTDSNVSGDVSVTAIFQLIPIQSGGGGRGPIITSACSSVTYGDWGICINGFQYRNILNQSPTNCALTPAQQSVRSMVCNTATTTPIIPVTPITPIVTTTPTVPPIDVLQIIANEAMIISTNNLQDLLLYLNVLGDPAKESASFKKYQTILNQDKKISAAEKKVINDFIVYGTPSTLRMGSGERAGVINSYFQAYGKLPNSQAEWSDVIKIANGRWPGERSISAENQAKVEFRKVYGRYPVMTNTHDQNAVIVIAYGLLPRQRNLASEIFATKTFALHYGHSPVNALAWNIVRAIAYSGAIR